MGTHPCFAREPLSPARVARFWSKVEKTDGCWVWGGTARNAYGSFSVCCKQLAAHRVAYELTVGPIPEGMVLDHICFNRACVNPDHLRPCTQKQNRENLRLETGSKSGVRGVYGRKNGTWVVRVQGVHYGTFPTLEEASAKAIEVRNSVFTHNDADRVA